MIRAIFGPVAGLVSTRVETKAPRYHSRSDIEHREAEITDRLLHTGFGLKRLSLERELRALVRMRERFSGENVHARHLPKDLFGYNRR